MVRDLKKSSQIFFFHETTVRILFLFQSNIKNSEVIIKPVFFFPDPFKGGDNIMVLVETFIWKDTTYKELIPSNTNQLQTFCQKDLRCRSLMPTPKSIEMHRRGAMVRIIFWIRVRVHSPVRTFDFPKSRFSTF